MSNTIVRSKAIILKNTDELRVDFSTAFSSTPYVNISPKENINVYLIEITNSYFKLAASSPVYEDTEIHYVAIEEV